MSKPKGEPITLQVGGTKSKRRSNVSLPERATPPEVVPSGSRRNTLTEDNATKPRKKIKLPLTPTIPEDEATDEIEKAYMTINETKKLNRNPSDASKISTVSGKSTKAAYTYDNSAFEGNPRVIESRNNSIRTPSRAPSEQSLEIYREQYCCFARRTKCEKCLLVTVIILIIIIVVLVIVIIVIAKQNKLQTIFSI